MKKIIDLDYTITIAYYFATEGTLEEFIEFLENYGTYDTNTNLNFFSEILLNIKKLNEEKFNEFMETYAMLSELRK